METIEKILSEAGRVDLWNELAPDLSITDHPLSELLPDYEIPSAERERIVHQTVDEGYFLTGPLMPETETRPVADAIRAIHAAGLPPAFCFVFDEVWQAFARLKQLLEPLLDPGYKFQTLGIWAWYIDNQGAGFRPHRDLNSLLSKADGRPSSLTVWIPFTDSTTYNGCMYVLPTNLDPNYPAKLGDKTIGNIQNVRALPAKAGSVLGWTANILHWGARSSHLAVEPRISVGVSYNRADSQHDPEHRGLDYNLGSMLQLEENPAISLEDRLNYIGESIWFYKGRLAELFPGSVEALLDFCRLHYVSPTRPAEVDASAASIVITGKKQIAQNLWQSGRRVEARIMLRQLCDDYPGDADAWQILGHLELSQGQIDAAEPCFRKALELQNDLQAARNGLERVLQRKGTNA